MVAVPMATSRSENRILEKTITMVLAKTGSAGPGIAPGPAKFL